MTYYIKLILLTSVLLTSCSVTKRANWHLKRAIKLNPSMVHTERDTVIKTIENKGELSFYNDTMVENNFVFISVKHVGEKTELYWFLKSVKIELPVENNTIIPPKSRYEIRQEQKTKRVYIKQTNKTERVKARQTSKIKRTYARSKAKQQKGSFFRHLLLVLVFVLGYTSCIFIRNLKEKLSVFKGLKAIYKKTGE